MKRLLLTMAVFGVVMLAARPGGAVAQGTDPAAVMAAFSTAAPNPDAQVALVADDVTITIAFDGRVWTGKEQARQFLGIMKMINARRELVGAWQVNGNAVSGTVMVTNANFEAWGVGRVEHTLEGVVEEGKLTSWTATMSPAERPRVAAGRDAAQPPAALPATGGSVSAGVLTWLLAVAGLMLALGLALRYTRVRIR